VSPRVVGVYGGSFDPVHRAHVEIARRARDQVPCDEVWFVPAAVAVQKPHGPMAGAQDRVDMLEAAIAGEPGLAISDVDLGHPGRRALDTVLELDRREPGVRWRWIMGQDSFDALDTWYRPEDLARHAPFVVQPRPGSSGTRLESFAGEPVTWLTGPELDVASTGLREALQRGERPEAIPAAVLGIIERRGLYRQEDER